MTQSMTVAPGPRRTNERGATPRRRPVSAVRKASSFVRLFRGFAVLLAAALAWEVFGRLANVPTYLLPVPTVIAAAILDSGAALVRESGRTLAEALAGLALGSGSAFLAAVLVQRSRTFELSVLPFTFILQSVPVVALTPVLALILGRNVVTVVVISGMICFFPVLVNTVRGLRSVRDEHVQLFHVMAARERQELTMLRLPSAVPYVFSGLRVAGTLCLPGAMVAEWMTSDEGLGYYIVSQAVLYATQNVWGGIIVSTSLTIAIFGAVVFAENVSLRWSGSSN